VGGSGPGSMAGLAETQGMGSKVSGMAWGTLRSGPANIFSQSSSTSESRSGVATRGGGSSTLGSTRSRPSSGRSVAAPPISDTRWGRICRMKSRVRISSGSRPGTSSIPPISRASISRAKAMAALGAPVTGSSWQEKPTPLVTRRMVPNSARSAGR